MTSYSVQETSGEERLKQHLSIRTRKATNSELGNVYSKPSGLPWALGLKSAPFSNITSMGSPNYLGLIVTRCMSTVRRLNVVETVALRQSLMLPSVFKSLELGEIVKRGSERASRILENLFTGEFSSTNPGDFVKSLRKLQNDVNRKIENIVELAKDMQDSSVETSFIYVNGRVAITGDKLSLDTSDIVKELEKYNNPDAFRLFAKSECEELASGFKDELLPERCNNESVITGLEEQFSYLSSEELEAFTAWTDVS